MPHLVDTGTWLAAEEVVKAGVEGVTLALPRRALPTWLSVHLKDLGFVAVHLTLDAGGHATHAGSDDDY